MDSSREPEYGCLYPGECLMGRGFHYRSQCRIPSILKDFTAPEARHTPGGRTHGAEPATRGAEHSRRPTPTPGQGAPAARERRPQAPSEPRNPEAAGTNGPRFTATVLGQFVKVTRVNAKEYGFGSYSAAFPAFTLEELRACAAALLAEAERLER